ncbi:hypothetical protein VYE96_12205 [Fusobacterium pseudoperiodonticum]|nr:hypothetical protein [Fusobacterium pseudoperiodonticum]
MKIEVTEKLKNETSNFIIFIKGTEFSEDLKKDIIKRLVKLVNVAFKEGYIQGGNHIINKLKEKRKELRMRITINKKTYDSDDYKGKVDLLLENICFELLNDNRFNFMDRLEFTFGYMLTIMEYITKNNYNPPFDFYKLDNDRDKLEIFIEQYKFIKYLLSGETKSYESYLDQLEQYEVFSKDKAIMILIDYKLARFGNEIFKEMGIEIVDRIDKGFIVKDNSKYIN